MSASALEGDDGRFELTVATWNINQWPLLGAGGRARRSLADVAKRVVDYDVVCLQECWSAAARELGLSVPYHFLDRTRSTVGFGSGLLTVSRHAVVAGASRRYLARRFPDSLAAKGMTLTRLSIHGVGNVNIFNTHLQAWRGAAVRRKQLRELAEFLGHSTPADLTILAGDLNCRPSLAELAHLREQLGLSDALAEVPQSCADSGPRGKIRFTGNDARVDHLLFAARPGIEVRVLETGVVPGPAGAAYPSDHHGLYARLVLGRDKANREESA